VSCRRWEEAELLMGDRRSFVSCEVGRGRHRRHQSRAKRRRKESSHSTFPSSMPVSRSTQDPKASFNQNYLLRSVNLPLWSSHLVLRVRKCALSSSKLPANSIFRTVHNFTLLYFFLPHMFYPLNRFIRTGGQMVPFHVNR
jgi:hypothetical protein